MSVVSTYSDLRWLLWLITVSAVFVRPLHHWHVALQRDNQALLFFADGKQVKRSCVRDEMWFGVTSPVTPQSLNRDECAV